MIVRETGMKSREFGMKREPQEKDIKLLLLGEIDHRY